MIPYTLLNAADASSNQTSSALDIRDMDHFSIQVDFSDASLEGSLKLQTRATDDSTMDWTDVDDSTQAVTGGEDHVWEISDATSRYFRAVWTRTAGTGNITIKALLKERHEYVRPH